MCSFKKQMLELHCMNTNKKSKYSQTFNSVCYWLYTLRTIKLGIIAL